MSQLTALRHLRDLTALFLLSQLLLLLLLASPSPTSDGLLLSPAFSALDLTSEVFELALTIFEHHLGEVSESSINLLIDSVVVFPDALVPVIEVPPELTPWKHSRLALASLGLLHLLLLLP